MKRWQKAAILAERTRQIGFIGLAACYAARLLINVPERQLMHHPIGGPLVWLFSILFIIGLMVMTPTALYLRQKEEGSLPGPSAPKWLEWTLKSIMYVLLAFVLMGAVIGTIAHFLEK